MSLADRIKKDNKIVLSLRDGARQIGLKRDSISAIESIIANVTYVEDSQLDSTSAKKVARIQVDYSDLNTFTHETKIMLDGKEWRISEKEPESTEHLNIFRIYTSQRAVF